MVNIIGVSSGVLLAEGNHKSMAVPHIAE